ncbi:hypothetical protein L218DRAFT_1003350 [Marasmius fiardii PR-910]|nr:hypothetical protein L218DRAFT_1003350 [Marasmius fiardii PR-910]
MHNEGPIVVLIDGLDECMQKPGGSSTFKQLLSLFSDPQTFKTTPFLRFIIASRPEGCIQQEFQHKEHIHHFPLDITSAETKADIAHFLAVKFSAIYIHNPTFENLCSKLDVVNSLSARASGLFIWAVIIFRYVEGFPSEGRLKKALALTPPNDALAALTGLYTTILGTIADEADEDIKRLIIAIFGLIIASGNIYRKIDERLKLTPSILLGLLKHCGYEVGHDILSLLMKLGSILPGDLELDSHVYLLHKSLDDFLVVKEISESWHVDAMQWNQQLAYACADIVQSTILENHPQHSMAYQYANYFWIPVNIVTGWKSTTSPPPSDNPFLEMLQKYFLQWIYANHLISVSRAETWRIFRCSSNP